MTAAEIIHTRANYKLPNMGLTSWKNRGKDGKILPSDTTIAKNYLTETEISELNRLVTMLLDYAENLAQRKKNMTMLDWQNKLAEFLHFNEYELMSTKFLKILVKYKNQ